MTDGISRNCRKSMIDDCKVAYNLNQIEHIVRL